MIEHNPQSEVRQSVWPSDIAFAVGAGTVITTSCAANRMAGNYVNIQRLKERPTSELTASEIVKVDMADSMPGVYYSADANLSPSGTPLGLGLTLLATGAYMGIRRLLHR